MAPVTVEQPDMTVSGGDEGDPAVEPSMETIKLENRNIAAEIAALLAEVEDEEEADEADEAPLVPLRKKRSKAVSEPESNRNSCFLTEIEDLEQEVFVQNKKSVDNSIVDFYLKEQTRNETMILSEEESDSVSTEGNVSLMKEPDELNDIQNVLESSQTNQNQSTEVDSAGLVKAIVTELTEEAIDETTDDEMGQRLIKEESSSVTMDNVSVEDENKFVGFAEENTDHLVENVGEESVLDDRIVGEGEFEYPITVELKSATEMEKSDSEENEKKNNDLFSADNHEETFGQSDTKKISGIEDKVDEADQIVGQEESKIKIQTNSENDPSQDKIEDIESIDTLETQIETSQVASSENDPSKDHRKIVDIESVDTLETQIDTSQVESSENDPSKDHRKIEDIEFVDTLQTQTNTGQIESKIETQTNSEDDPSQDHYKSEEPPAKDEKCEVLPEGYHELLALTFAIFIALVIMFN